MLRLVVQRHDEMLISLGLIVHYEDVFVEVVDQLNEILIEDLQNEFSVKINILFWKYSTMRINVY